MGWESKNNSRRTLGKGDDMGEVWVVCANWSPSIGGEWWDGNNNFASRLVRKSRVYG
jgi:hypothetical protein